MAKKYKSILEKWKAEEGIFDVPEGMTPAQAFLVDKPMHFTDPKFPLKKGGRF